MKNNSFHSIKVKFISLICAMSLFSLVISSAVFYYIVYDISNEQAKESVANETKLISLRFGELFRIIKNDVSMLLKTPPIQGIIRSKKNNNIDNIGKSTFQQWRERLENIFLAVMQNNDSYMQIRYIGVDDEGREIVRVNRDLQDNHNYTIVSSDKLQSKNNEPYFTEALKLQKDDIYISSITYNREHGKITNDFTSMMRVMTPVFDGEKLFGFITINIDYPAFFKEITEELSPSMNLMVINNDGSYFEYDHKNKEYFFINNDDKSKPIPTYIKYGQSLKNSKGSLVDNDSYTYYVKNNVGANSNSGVQYFYTALQMQNTELFAESTYLLRFIIMLMLVTTITKSLIGSIFANKLINPLTKITSAIRNYTPARGEDLHLPIDRKDEIGLLACSFKEMINEIEQFVYTVSHDLKQPLRNVSSYISFIKLDYENLLDKQGKSYLQGLENSVKRMDMLISELLNYTRIGYSKEQNSVDLNVVLQEVLVDLDTAIKSSKANIVHDDLPVVIGNKRELHALFQNLLDNAIKYSKKDIAPCIQISVSTTRDKYIIEFKDNGVGIEQQYHNKIFELFQRVASTEKLDGSGIGLAHCKKIVEQHHGKIEVHSTKNEGSVFIISLPKNNHI